MRARARTHTHIYGVNSEWCSGGGGASSVYRIRYTVDQRTCGTNEKVKYTCKLNIHC